MQQPPFPFGQHIKDLMDQSVTIKRDEQLILVTKASVLAFQAFGNWARIIVGSNVYTVPFLLVSIPIDLHNLCRPDVA